MKHAFILAGAMLGSSVFAQSPPSVDPARLTQLINQLGSTRYREREQAASELMKMGRSAKSALIEGAKNSDPEVSVRCQQLLPQALALDLAHRIEMFEKDIEGKTQHDLPSWKVFREKIGTDADSRKLFVEMMKINGTLLEYLEEQPNKVTDRVQQRTSEIYQEIFGNPFGGRVGNFRPAAMNNAELSCLLFASSSPAFKPAQVDWLIVNLYNQPSYMERIKDDKGGGAYRKVFFNYMDARMDDNLLNQTTWLMAQHNVKGAADVFAKALRDGKATQIHTKANVICTVGTLGNATHVKSLEPLLKETTMIQQFQLNGQRGEVRLQDVALANMIHLSGKKPTDFGFKLFSVIPNQPIQYHQLGFTSDAERTAAFKKWDEASKK